MAELLFEIFCEEIPARMQVRAGQDLAKAMTDGLKKSGLEVIEPQTFTGPRRLVFTADIPVQSPDVNEERKGPRVGAPEQALVGFMKAAGLTDISQAEIQTDPKKGDFYVAIKSSKGRPTSEILMELIPSVMNNFPWPKSMKSGTSSFKWVRPLQRMICLLGGEIIPVAAGEITASNITEGHRRHGKGPFEIKDLEGYIATLEGKGHVLVSAEKRKDIIAADARKLCAAKGLELVEDEGLLNEVAGLAEWPVVILGDMDPSFLELPAEVIRLSMRTHQKYFAVRDPKTGKLAPNFVVVANQAAPDGGIEIAKGNSKVLSARLADAQFFQSEDAKKKLIDYYDKLGTVVFHKELGSIRDKAERVEALARELAPKVGADADKAEQAARLAKCDLVTQTVVEFTSLQGQIGAQMYRVENNIVPGLEPGSPATQTPAQGGGHSGGEDHDAGQIGGANSAWSTADYADIAAAIEDHYKPQGPSDAVPTNPVAVAVALADKLDTLVGFWAIDEKPTGSKDPFALRRAALGVVRIVLENGLRLGLGNHLENILQVHEAFSKVLRQRQHLESFYQHEEGEFSATDKLDRIGLEQRLNKLERLYKEKLRSSGFEVGKVSISTEDLLSFILDRLKVYLRDQGKRHDIIDAVLKNGEDDLVAIVNRVTALQSFLDTPEGENLLAGYKRAANILKAEAKKAKANKGSLPEGAPTRPADPHGAALFDALQIAAEEIEPALAAENYAEAMTALAKLRAPIDTFFTEVQVISDDTAVKENNLRLLGLIRDTARQIADFEAIQG